MWRWIPLAVVVLILDQWSKWEIVRRIVAPVRVSSFLNLILVYNPGAAFGFLSQAPGWQNMLFVAIAVVMSIVILGALLRLQPGQGALATALMLVLGGALGNLVDRLRLGKVVDFIDFHLGHWHWYTFNIADSAITIGAVLLALDALGFLGRGRHP